jgi:heme o synthase
MRIRERLLEYYKVTKPGIIRGNTITAAGGFFLASRGQIDWWLFLVVCVGTSLIIASACVFNNYLDRHIDAKMSRTKTRALAIGAITHTQALWYASILGLLGLGLLLLWVHPLATLIGVLGHFLYVVVYGYWKRRSEHGTLIGTLPGAASLLAGYVAVTHQFDIATLILFLIMVSWQMVHFYAIAIMGMKGYAAAGIPVLPVKKGVKRTKQEMLVYCVAFIVVCALLYVFAYVGLVYLVIMSVLGGYWLYLGIKGWSVESDAMWARTMFKFSLRTLSIFSILISLSTILP